ncbi:TetR/AcrR family transcriptional regulator [Nocardia exalbida]|uniref:TetR/AcrR family transcriptional regulator n=1 Tax=Nocardia exalbida TaxID=290231 RepID=UPI0003060206|nr:TetR/AcrR family transcriptional regulator [Nocardia exalbida]
MTATVGRQYGGRAVVERKAERRQRFLDAATRIFAERGYADCSLADVCAAAGLSKRQFYEEFQAREDVLVAAYDRIQDEAAAAVLGRLADLDPRFDLPAAMTAVVTAYLASIGSDPYRAKVAFIEVVGVSDRMERHRRERRHGWAAMLESHVVPVVAPGSRVRGAPGWGASALIGAINGLAHEWVLADPRPTVTELVDLLVPIAMSLIERADETASEDLPG